MNEKTIKIYLDNCCYNRPFDEQNQDLIRLETKAKLVIQNRIRQGLYSLVWSFIVLEIKFERVRCIAGLAEMNEISCFAKLSHFGATGRRCSEDHFFSPAQYS